MIRGPRYWWRRFRRRCPYCEKPLRTGLVFPLAWACPDAHWSIEHDHVDGTWIAREDDGKVMPWLVREIERANGIVRREEAEETERARMRAALDALWVAWRRYPGLRVGQLLDNALTCWSTFKGEPVDLFTVTDEKLAEILRWYGNPTFGGEAE